MAGATPAGTALAAIVGLYNYTPNGHDQRMVRAHSGRPLPGDDERAIGMHRGFHQDANERLKRPSWASESWAANLSLDGDELPSITSDKSAGRTLSTKEMGAVVHLLNMSDEERSRLLADVDLDDNDDIEYEEMIVAVLRKQMGEGSSPAALVEFVDDVAVLDAKRRLRKRPSWAAKFEGYQLSAELDQKLFMFMPL